MNEAYPTDCDNDWGLTAIRNADSGCDTACRITAALAGAKWATMTHCLNVDHSIVNVVESKRSYSSVYNNDAKGTGHAQGMLDSPQAWSAGSSSVGQWMQMDLGADKQVSGVVTQPRGNNYQFVKSFTANSRPIRILVLFQCQGPTLVSARTTSRPPQLLRRR